VFEDVLNQIQARIRVLQYVMTLHAEEEMNDDGLTIYDIEAALLVGQITERQRDRVTTEWKYVVEGRIDSGEMIAVVVKFGANATIVIITVYRI
jgi:hypothetical protein